jgi:hypothetical protein
MKKIFKINFNNKYLYCSYSKEKIKIGEEYCIVFEPYFDDLISKTYKIEYLDMLDEEEDE